MTVLEKIVEDKLLEVKEKKKKIPYSELESNLDLTRKNNSLKRTLIDQDSSGIISEIKKRSPSKGVINDKISVSVIAKSYQDAGACAISVLTDEKYFSGTVQDLKDVRSVVKLPILRKDFILDEYQILEARNIGADAILLIARILSPQRTLELAKFAKSLELDVLLEVHSEIELEENLNDEVDIVGINNRNLDTLEIDLALSFNLVDKIPKKFVKISESGISSPETAKKLWQLGYNGFLIGENFMKEESPGDACSDFIKVLKSLE